jgi:chromate transporter
MVAPYAALRQVYYRPYEDCETAPALPPRLEPGARAAGVSRARMTLVFLWLGATSFGGRSAAFVQRELVDRRHWLEPEDYVEHFTLARILPGSTGLSTVALIAQALWGSTGAVLCMLPYVLPGALLALLLGMLLLGGEQPPWLQGALRGCAAAAVALFVATAWRNARALHARAATIGLLGASFLAYGPLGAGLLPVLVGFGALSLFVHRPRRRTPA